MLQKSLHDPKRCLSCVLGLFLFCMAFLSSVPVYAVPADSEAATGWIEVQCTEVPDDFSDAVTVILVNQESSERYKIHCFKDNDYIGRMEVPVGKYDLDQVSTQDAFVYEAFSDIWDFEITEDMPAAYLIEVKVKKNDIPDDYMDLSEIPEEPEHSEEVPGSDAQEAPTVQDTPAAEPDTSAGDVSETTDDLSSVQTEDSSDDAIQAEPEDPSLFSKANLIKALSKLGFVLLGTGIFVAVVFGAVYIIRSRLDD